MTVNNGLDGQSLGSRHTEINFNQIYFPRKQLKIHLGPPEVLLPKRFGFAFTLWTLYNYGKSLLSSFRLGQLEKHDFQLSSRYLYHAIKVKLPGRFNHNWPALSLWKITCISWYMNHKPRNSRYHVLFNVQWIFFIPDGNSLLLLAKCISSR